MNDNRSSLVDILVVAAIVVFSAITYVGIVTVDVARWVPILGLTGIVVSAVVLVVSRFASRPDHVRALQSHKMMRVANEALSYMRRGLTPESAQAVCGIVLAETSAAAVAITNMADVLGFAGIGEDHHSVGGPIITRGTRESLETGEIRILATKEEIGCPREDCHLNAAIVVPLMMRGMPVGTLKFYYTTPSLLNETQIAMAEGLADTLSTQLELSELERQTELATRMELKALQAQINPHFLFNTINTIASLIRTDPTRARVLLREFAAFYRRTLESGEELIPLETELEQTLRYLTFEQARFGERIEVEQAIAPEHRQLLVPAFIVQPVVENSVAHGMRPTGVLTIRMSSRACEDGSVYIDIADNGVGISAASLPHVLESGYGRGLGIALKNVDDRLKGHFGPGSGVTIESTEGAGATVSLVLAHVGDGGSNA
ncbi:MAG: histidine kinase [Coriobacteriia bacterium]|nr:histidine kinase [Coriobacteriia bacterium]